MVSRFLCILFFYILPDIGQPCAIVEQIHEFAKIAIKMEELYDGTKIDSTFITLKEFAKIEIKMKELYDGTKIDFRFIILKIKRKK